MTDQTKRPKFAVSVFVTAGSPSEAEDIVLHKLGPLIGPLLAIGAARKVLE